jgi:hypothetical protein
MHVETWKEHMQGEFFAGYELGLSQRSLPPSNAKQYFRLGWSMGHIEAEGWLRKLSLREKVRQFYRHSLADLRNAIQHPRSKRFQAVEAAF